MYFYLFIYLFIYLIYSLFILDVHNKNYKLLYCVYKQEISLSPKGEANLSQV